MKRIERRWWMTERPRHYAFTGPRRAQARSNRRHQPARHGDEGQRPARSDCHATELQRPAGGGPEQLDQADHWPLPRRLGRPGSRDQHPGTPSSVGPRHGRLPRARPRMRNQPDPGRGRTDSSSNRHVQLPRVLRQQRLTRFLADELGASHGTQGEPVALAVLIRGFSPYVIQAISPYFYFTGGLATVQGRGPPSGQPAA
jgi:hypothetical protein